MRRIGEWMVLLVLGMGLVGCASGPKPLPQCEGPWLPVNTPLEVRHAK